MSLALKLAAAMGGASGAKVYAKWDTVRSTGFTFSNGDLTATVSGSAYKCAFIDQLKSSGKHYFEISLQSATQEHALVICDSAHPSGVFAGNTSGPYGKYYGVLEAANGITNGVNNYGIPISNGGVVCVALDATNKKVWMGAAGVYANGGDPATGANPMWTWADPLTLGYAHQFYYNNHVITLNAGETAFAHSVPSGFNAGLYTE